MYLAKVGAEQLLKMGTCMLCSFYGIVCVTSPSRFGFGRAITLIDHEDVDNTALTLWPPHMLH